MYMFVPYLLRALNQSFKASFIGTHFSVTLAQFVEKPIMVHSFVASCKLSPVIMAALRSRCGHYIFDL